jgi:hypothetical protein
MREVKESLLTDSDSSAGSIVTVKVVLVHLILVVMLKERFFRRPCTGYVEE